MPPEESISVPPSEEQGNISVETETPPPAEITETDPPPVVEEKTETPTVVEPELFELPDGRKVDAQTLSKEWKENFYPDYTRKSQALAAKEPPQITKPTVPHENPDWTPQNYPELIRVARDEAIKEIESREAARIEQQKSIETAIETQLSDIKKTDPSLNENALFLHANKYGFRDLKVAHQNMKDMSAAIKAVKQQTATDIAKRADPVSVSPGATGARPNPSQFATAQEYLNAVKAAGIK